MPWAVLTIFVVVAIYAALRLRAVGAVFSGKTLGALSEALPEMQRRAIGGEMGVFHVQKLLLVYSIRKSDEGWHHHVSTSSASPALAAGTFFLAIGRTAFHLDDHKPVVFVTQRRVFHLEAILTEDEHRAAVERPVELAGVDVLREAGSEGRKALLPRIEKRNVALKIHGDATRS